jgi:hypothetical protein
MQPSLASKILCSLAAAVLAAVGLAAIGFQSHTGQARFKGIVTLQGGAAIDFGIVMLWMALMPLVVWLPRRWVGWSLVVWGGGVLVWLAWILL